MNYEYDIMHKIEKSGYFIGCERCIPVSTVVSFITTAPITGTVKIEIDSYNQIVDRVPGNRTTVNKIVLGVHNRLATAFSDYDNSVKINAGVNIEVELVIPKHVKTETVIFYFKKLEGGLGSQTPETERSEGSDARLT